MNETKSNTKMRAGEVFLGDYTAAVEAGDIEVPAEAKEGPWALGQAIMVSRTALGEDFRLPDVPEWFVAQVCLPRGTGNWYRWYDPYVHYETEFPLHEGFPSGKPGENVNYSYVGKLWRSWKPTNFDPGPEPGEWYKPLEYWAYPVAVWRELFEAAS